MYMVHSTWICIILGFMKCVSAKVVSTRGVECSKCSNCIGISTFHRTILFVFLSFRNFVKCSIILTIFTIFQFSYGSRINLNLYEIKKLNILKQNNCMIKQFITTNYVRTF